DVPGRTYRVVQQRILPIPLPPYRPMTNVIAGNSLLVYSVRVQSWATGDTNKLITSDRPLNVIHNQFIPPTAPGDTTLLAASTTGSATLVPGGTPDLIPGSRYFLAIQNTTPLPA